MSTQAAPAAAIFAHTAMGFRRQSSPQRLQGFALFEVIAAMLVLSVSYFGTALLLAKTASEGRSAVFMGRAAVFASDMAERMRVSPGARAAYSLNAGATYQQAADSVAVMGQCGGLYTVPGAAPATLGDCTTAQETAHYDVTTWVNQLRAGLPGGAGFVLPPTPGRPTHLIIVAWVEPVTQRDASGSVLTVNQKCNSLAGARLAAPEQVRCYALELQL